MSRIKAPKHRRRQSSTQRLDVARMNRNRTTYRDGVLTIQSDDGRTSETIRDSDAGRYDVTGIEFDDLADVTVQIPRGSRHVVLRVVTTRSALDAVNVIALKTGVSLSKVTASADGVSAICRGDVDAFQAYLAGHSDTRGKFTLTDVESAKATSGATQHERETMLSGQRPQPQRIDYSAGRNQPKATYAIDNRYSVNDIDHTDSRNGRKLAGLRAPDIPHTEH